MYNFVNGILLLSDDARKEGGVNQMSKLQQLIVKFSFLCRHLRKENGVLEWR